MSILSAKHFHDEAAARKFLEAIRWPEGPVCPHCGSIDEAYSTKKVGVYRCGAKECRKDFSVTVGTLFERSHIPLHKWLLAAHLLSSSKKGMSAHQLHRTLGVTYKSAWFLAHRIREAMREGGFAPMGSGGGVVEIDETFIGKDSRKIKGRGRGYEHKLKVLSLVDRESGNARSVVVDDLKTKTLVPILRANIAKEARVMTDEASHYRHLDQEFAEHHALRHGEGEYGRGEAHTNTIEGFFSIFKRGMKGVYQHCGEQHLHRYLAEFDFRYCHRRLTDAERTTAALRRIDGRRLTYGDPVDSSKG